MEEIEIKNNEYCDSYPTRIVINHNLRTREYPIYVDIEKMILEKEDILNKINLIFEELKEYYLIKEGLRNGKYNF